MGYGRGCPSGGGLRLYLAAKAWHLTEGRAADKGAHGSRKNTKSNISAAFSGIDIAATLSSIKKNAVFYDDSWRQVGWISPPLSYLKFALVACAYRWCMA